MAQRRAERNRLAAIQSGKQSPARPSLPPREPQGPIPGAFVQSDLGNQIITVGLGPENASPIPAETPREPPESPSVLPSSPEEAGTFAPAPPPEGIFSPSPPPEDLPSLPLPTPPAGGGLPQQPAEVGGPGVLDAAPERDLPPPEDWRRPYHPGPPPVTPGEPRSGAPPEPPGQESELPEQEWPQDWLGTPSIPGLPGGSPSERSQIFGVDGGMPPGEQGVHHVPPEAPPVSTPPPASETADAQPGREERSESLDVLREIRDMLTELKDAVEGGITVLETLPDTLRELVGYGD